MQRSSGILMHITSLPSPYGIGTLGKEAYSFVDFLQRSRQKYWQMLPVGPTSYGDSPYQSFSTFAGNPYFIDLDQLIADGLLTHEEVERPWGDNPLYVDYYAVYSNRFDILRLAYSRRQDEAEFCAFKENTRWLENYALFMALKDRFGGKAWTDWEDEDIRKRIPQAVERYKEMLSQSVDFYCYVQHLFSKQWSRLKAYAASKGVAIIGDLPIYVPLDSADVWASPETFQLDQERRPVAVAGVPPDYFSADGQLWGNPLYNWERLGQTGYAWWLERIGRAAELFDVIRIDHFRGLSSYWSVPYGDKTAVGGRWVNGPGMDFVRVIKTAFPQLEIIAEDLGYLTDDVRELLAQSGYPGMKVLQFAFDSREPSDYLPHNYPRYCACYTGTHDNTTAAAWFDECNQDDKEMAIRYLGLSPEEGYHWGLIRGGMSSVADLFVAQLQDYLGLEGWARMNTPGTLGNGNWCWRAGNDAATDDLADRIAYMVRICGR